MTKLRRFAVLLALPIATWAADPGLLKLVMPDAKVIAGIQVDQTKNSLFGQYILSHMQVDDAGFKSFIAQTGFDPRRDVTEIMIASNWESNSAASRWLVMARGAFDLAQNRDAAQGTGITTTNFQGVNILVHSSSLLSRRSKTQSPSSTAPTRSWAIWLPSKAAIGRQKSGAAPAGELLVKVSDLSVEERLLVCHLVPVSEFAGAMPDPNLSGAMKGNLLAAIHEASGGIRFGETVTISGEASTRSEKDAQALVDVFRFVAGLIQLNSQNNAVAGQVSTLLDTLDSRRPAMS